MSDPGWGAGVVMSDPPSSFPSPWPCDLSHDAFGVTPLPRVEQTDACKNITFARFATRVVNITFPHTSYAVGNMATRVHSNYWRVTPLVKNKISTFLVVCFQEAVCTWRVRDVSSTGAGCVSRNGTGTVRLTTGSNSKYNTWSSRQARSFTMWCREVTWWMCLI